MNINGKWYSETELAAYVKELESRISELEDKHHNECAQIAHYDDELKELKEIFSKVDTGAIKPKDYLDLLCEWSKMKELLKAAVEDINAAEACDTCEYYPVINGAECQKDDCYKWRYADDALALIGKDGEQNEKET